MIFNDHSASVSLTTAFRSPRIVGRSRRVRNDRASCFLPKWLGLAWCLGLIALTPARAQLTTPVQTIAGTGALATARREHTATALPNGKVLVVGGLNSTVLASAEIFDPATGVWTATGSLAAARRQHTATLLPGGKVLVAGGFSTSSVSSYLGSAELYDPATGLWTAAATLGTARGAHTATLLPNGQVLVAGGGSGIAGTRSAELYAPATGTWSVTGSLIEARDLHTATLIPLSSGNVSGGRVLVVGGRVAANRAEVYDPVTGTWSAIANLAASHDQHTATLLPDGKVLVAGGSSVVELYDPMTAAWTTVAALSAGRSRHTATLIDGKVVVFGGTVGPVNGEFYNPDSNAWTAVPVSLLTARYAHTATLLPGGTLLLAGGRNGTTDFASTEIYSYQSDSSALVTLPTAISGTATLLPDGAVFLAGGSGSTGALTATMLYYESTDTLLFSSNGFSLPLATARYRHTSTLLANGKVLVAAGAGAASLATAELFDVGSRTRTNTGSLATARQSHTATLLPDGRVLAAGGLGASALASAERYDPVAGTWSATGPLGTARQTHTATLLPNGKVLVAGGIGASALNSAELYDPAGNAGVGSWSATGAMATARQYHTATLLPGGRVLVRGGLGTVGGRLNSAEIYNPASGTWSAAGSIISSAQDVATLLPSGKVLAVNISTTGQLYDPATGVWTTTEGSFTGGTFTSATLLPSGRVFIVSPGGAFPSKYRVFDPRSGTGPQITGAAFDANSRLVLTGSGFRGLASASGGNGSQDSPTNFPLAQLRRLDNEQTVFLSPDPTSPSSDTQFISGPLPAFGAGYVMATVFQNGVGGNGVVLPSPAPNIVVEQPAGSFVVDGGSRSFAATPATPGVLTFTIKNPSFVSLTGLTITKDGTNAADFTVTANPTAPVAPGTSTTFTVRFATTTAGTKTAALHIANNIPGKTPYDLNLTGQLLNYTTDTDTDGMSDAAEFDLAGQSFNWQVSQPALVNNYYNSANGAGLYTQTQYTANRTAGQNDVIGSPNTYSLYTLGQIQNLNVGVPLLTKDTATGQFKLTIGVRKSTDLTSVPFADFPMTGTGVTTTINAQGKLEFVFPSTDNAAFFRVLSQ